jgi:hypothetical protein
MNAMGHLLPTMSKDEATALILTSKKYFKLSWEEIGEKIGMSPVWTHSACFGMNSSEGIGFTGLLYRRAGGKAN